MINDVMITGIVFGASIGCVIAGIWIYRQERRG